MNATILHNPRCSKSRATLAPLHEAGATVTVVDYPADPPPVAELSRPLARLAVPRQRPVAPERARGAGRG